MNFTHLGCSPTRHFKNNDSEFSERLRGVEIAVYVNVCRFEIFKGECKKILDTLHSNESP